MSRKRKIWSRPWGYPEAWLIVAGILLVSYLWQWIMGYIPEGQFVHPFSTILLTLLIGAIIYIGWQGSRKGKRPPTAVLFLLSPAATITSITLLVIHLLIMGFSTQVPLPMASSLGGFFHSSGWSAMIHSYPFNFSYLYLLLVLGSTTIRYILRPRKWNLRSIGFVINHLGLFSFLLFALLSGGEMKRYTMVLEQDEIEWRGRHQGSRELTGLPIALELKSFHMDEYPPQLILINGATGQVLPEGKVKEYLSLEQVPLEGTLVDWRVSVDSFMPLAAPILDDSTVFFTQFGSSGAAPAAHLVARRGNEVRSGWVSCGSYLFPYRGLGLPDSLAIVMPYPEPKQYYSSVEYLLQSGEQGEAVIAVNKPLKVGDWYVYQLNYDQERGRWATSTELELVYDPFIKPVLISLWALLLGALTLLLGPANAPCKQRPDRTSNDPIKSKQEEELES